LNSIAESKYKPTPHRFPFDDGYAQNHSPVYHNCSLKFATMQVSETTITVNLFIGKTYFQVINIKRAIKI
jgi:hypothetical protein